jgi:hypothetical protein
MKSAQKILRYIQPIQHFNEQFYPIEVPGKKGQIEWIESVTTVLQTHRKPGLEIRRGELGNREMDRRIEEGAARGSIVHHGNAIAVAGGAIGEQGPWYKKQKLSAAEIKKLTKAYAERFVMVPSEKEFQAIRRWRRFLDLTHPRILAMNVTVYSLQIHLAGTLDLIPGFSDVLFGKLWLDGFKITDWKTGIELPEHKIQVSGYYKLLQVMRPEIAAQITGGLLVYQDSDNESGPVPHLKLVHLTPEEMERYFVILQHVHAMWRFDNPNVRPEVFSYRPVIIGNQPLEKGEAKPKWQTIKADSLLSYSADLRQQKPKRSISRSKSTNGKPKPKKRSRPQEPSLFETTRVAEPQSTSRPASSERGSK